MGYTGDQTMKEGLPVAGYRPQSESNVELVNHNKLLEEAVLRVLDKLAQASEVDKRWLAIGRTAIEQGFMAVNRSIFRPGRIDMTDAKWREVLLGLGYVPAPPQD